MSETTTEQQTVREYLAELSAIAINGTSEDITFESVAKKRDEIINQGWALYQFMPENLRHDYVEPEPEPEPPTKFKVGEYLLTYQEISATSIAVGSVDANCQTKVWQNEDGHLVFESDETDLDGEPEATATLNITRLLSDMAQAESGR